MKRDTRTTLQQHTAQQSLEGYAYQIQQAILLLFGLEEGSSLGIEIVDDIHIESAGMPTDYFQVKNYHAGPAVAMSGASVDFWKTLGIWAAAIRDNSIDLNSTRHFVMMTRAKIRKGSIPELIANRSDVADIAYRLRQVSRPQGKESGHGYDAVQALDASELTALVQRLVLLDEQPASPDLDDEFRRLLRQKTFAPAVIDTALDQLRGWVFKQAILGLEQRRILIDEESFQTELRTIRDRLAASELHPRYARNIPTPEELAGQTERTYVRQLLMIRATEKMRHRAIVAFLRASAERSEWLARGEIAPDDLILFDGDLFDRWKTEHDDMCDRSADDTDDASLCAEAVNLIGIIERMEVHFRPGCQYQYLTSGSYQILADDVLVGWHRDFKRLLQNTANVAPSGKGSPRA